VITGGIDGTIIKSEEVAPSEGSTCFRGQNTKDMVMDIPSVTDTKTKQLFQELREAEKRLLTEIRKNDVAAKQMLQLQAEETKTHADANIDRLRSALVELDARLRTHTDGGYKKLVASFNDCVGVQALHTQQIQDIMTSNSNYASKTQETAAAISRLNEGLIRNSNEIKTLEQRIQAFMERISEDMQQVHLRVQDMETKLAAKPWTNEEVLTGLASQLRISQVHASQPISVSSQPVSTLPSVPASPQHEYPKLPIHVDNDSISKSISPQASDIIVASPSNSRVANTTAIAIPESKTQAVVGAIGNTDERFVPFIGSEDNRDMKSYTSFKRPSLEFRAKCWTSSVVVAHSIMYPFGKTAIPEKLASSKIRVLAGHEDGGRAKFDSEAALEQGDDGVVRILLPAIDLSYPLLVVVSGKLQLRTG
jgi:hypothetical protein